jgi:hypothetical protein
LEAQTWDWWRKRYERFTFEEMRLFYEIVGQDHPVQNGANFAAATDFCATLPEYSCVVELGGWTGDLAAAVLAQNTEIAAWTNCDIWPDGQERSVCTDRRYHVQPLLDWPWKYNVIRSDAFISTHTIEHMKATHLEQLVARLDCKRVFIEAPLAEGNATNVSWTGYLGSHILEWEWGPVEDCFARYGYTVDVRDGWVRWFSRT